MKIEDADYDSFADDVAVRLPRFIKQVYNSKRLYSRLFRDRQRTSRSTHQKTGMFENSLWSGRSSSLRCRVTSQSNSTSLVCIGVGRVATVLADQRQVERVSTRQKPHQQLLEIFQLIFRGSENRNRVIGTASQLVSVVCPGLPRVGRGFPSRQMEDPCMAPPCGMR